jgi:hypothetical protein
LLKAVDKKFFEEQKPTLDGTEIAQLIARVVKNISDEEKSFPSIGEAFACHVLQILRNRRNYFASFFREALRKKYKARRELTDVPIEEASEVVYKQAFLDVPKLDKSLKTRMSSEEETVMTPEMLEFVSCCTAWAYTTVFKKAPMPGPSWEPFRPAADGRRCQHKRKSPDDA